MKWSGPADSSHVVVFAPGDEGRIDDAHLSCVVSGLSAAGVRVVCFDSPGGEDSAARDQRMAGMIRDAADACGAATLVLGGLSRGARVSVGLAQELGAAALVLFAYPFHSRRSPDVGSRVHDLASVSGPVWLGQGSRDALGNQPQVVGYRLPTHVHIHWLADANHALRPRPSSGFTMEGQLSEASSLAAAFVLRS